MRQSRCSTSGTKLVCELLRDQAFHQPLRIGEVPLAPAGSAIRLRLGEMERAREPRRTIARPASGSPVLFQGFPHRPPVLRGRLHDDFLDVVLDEPVGQATQIGWRRTDILTLEVAVAVDLDVGHHDRQHLLVDVNSRDPVRHALLLWGAESVPRRIIQGRELSPASLLFPAAPPVADDGHDLHLRSTMLRSERRVLERALAQSAGSKRQAARLLGIDERNLGYYLRKHGLR